MVFLTKINIFSSFVWSQYLNFCKLRLPGCLSTTELSRHRTSSECMGIAVVLRCKRVHAEAVHPCVLKRYHISKGEIIHYVFHVKTMYAFYCQPCRLNSHLKHLMRLCLMNFAYCSRTCLSECSPLGQTFSRETSRFEMAVCRMMCIVCVCLLENAIETYRHSVEWRSILDWDGCLLYVEYCILCCVCLFE